MTKPVFDIEYQAAYTSAVQFQTKINEKHTGGEQRYPVWTYPKRTFTLKLDKNFNGRQALENFYINVCGKEGKFLFKWDKSRGGNDKTYICRFDDDSFKQNIYDYGFSESEIKFVTIDNNEISSVSDFDFWHSAECDYSLEFGEIEDKIFSAQDNVKNYWSKPKRKWCLHFQKMPKIAKKSKIFSLQNEADFVLLSGFGKKTEAVTAKLTTSVLTLMNLILTSMITVTVNLQ